MYLLASLPVKQRGLLFFNSSQHLFPSQTILLIFVFLIKSNAFYQVNTPLQAWQKNPKHIGYYA
jgi:hypothetical protein